MPNKDPNFIKEMFTALTASNVWLGAIMAIAMTWLRNLYDERERNYKREIVECALSGGITLSIASILDFINIPSSASIFVGGAIGLFGVNWVRRKTDKYIDKKIDGDKHDD